MGFKGAWLSLVLTRLGAVVTGFGLRDPATRLLYDDAAVGQLVESVDGDVRDASAVASAFARSQPEVVFHLAAESLVRRSYTQPRQTFETNVVGTANVLEAVRDSAETRAVVVAGKPCDLTGIEFDIKVAWRRPQCSGSLSQPLLG